MDDKPRIRLNCKQTAKNLWQFECTVEYHEETIKIYDEKDVAQVETKTLGAKLLDQIKSAEKAFREDGRKIVGDEV